MALRDHCYGELMVSPPVVRLPYLALYFADENNTKNEKQRIVR